MINFTVGPVQSNEEVLALGAQSAPYFRTPEFSEVMLENERLMKKFAGAPDGSRAVFITGSGTASMEAAVINLLSAEDRVLVVNGGGFGERFNELCGLHNIPHTSIMLKPGCTLKPEELASYENAGYTAFLVNIHETSTGVLYDIELIKDFCARNNLFLIVDAISAFLADPLDMSEDGIDVVITGSQKALAVPPGISVLVLAPKALMKLETIDSHCMYLDLKLALRNGERGQTPFTPAVTTLLQINARLRDIEANGGAISEINRVAALADDFRGRIDGLPFKVFAETPSNAVTALYTEDMSARDIFMTLKDEYGIWICPNGGELAERVFRVGHIGNLTLDDNTVLINALRDYVSRR